MLNLQRRRNRALTPYHPDVWLHTLLETDLIIRYPHIPRSLIHGFDAGIQPVLLTYTPPNHPSILSHTRIFNEMVSTEFEKQRYIGPFTREELETEIGPFQSSPISIIPKPAQPDKFRIIQNLSYPRNNPLQPSINQSIDTGSFPCTWGTFNTISAIIASLPTGTEAAIRDVAEAYRTIPITPTQWPALVVRLSEDDQFAIDTTCCFGLASSAGIHGIIGDAGTDIMRAKGIGPIAKWVDDHIFFRLPRHETDQYNRFRRNRCQLITDNGGKHQKRGRTWYKGDSWPSGHIEEWQEDMFFPIKNFPNRDSSQRHAYTLNDIDDISNLLGIPWKTSKDQPFSSTVEFLGFRWDLNKKSVSLTQKKVDKYKRAIHDWLSKRSHSLDELRKLYGKLMHACNILPQGRAYLTGLEVMFPLFHGNPFLPRTPPRVVPDELNWWITKLSELTLSRPIPSPVQIVNVKAFSDASSSTGIGITIGNQWRAWTLVQDWERDGRNIGWAEAIGFELLAITVTRLYPEVRHFLLHGDNTGVVEGWWVGRSRSQATNVVFRRIHRLEEELGVKFHTRYVESENNPADGPSRGIFPQHQRILPPIPIPSDTSAFLLDVGCAPFLSDGVEERSTRNRSKQVDRTARRRFEDVLFYNTSEHPDNFSTTETDASPIDSRYSYL
jgi:hypothetical protein